MADVDEWFAETGGSYVVHAPPLAGTTSFVDAVETDDAPDGWYDR